MVGIIWASDVNLLLNEKDKEGKIRKGKRVIICDKNLIGKERTADFNTIRCISKHRTLFGGTGKDLEYELVH